MHCAPQGAAFILPAQICTFRSVQKHNPHCSPCTAPSAFITSLAKPCPLSKLLRTSYGYCITLFYSRAASRSAARLGEVRPHAPFPGCFLELPSRPCRPLLPPPALCLPLLGSHSFVPCSELTSIFSARRSGHQGAAQTARSAGERGPSLRSTPSPTPPHQRSFLGGSLAASPTAQHG